MRLVCRYVIKGCIAIAILVGAAYLLAYSCGRGSRGLFSPDSFEVKVQSEWLLPPSEIPLYRSNFEYQSPNELVEYLVAKGYWSKQQADEPQWILLFRWNDQWRDGHTGFYREMVQAEKWIEWSEDNPKFAARLWPLVLARLRSNESGIASHFMYLARTSATIEEFEEQVENDPDLK